MRIPHQEFIEANAQAIQAITYGADQIMANATDLVTVERRGPDSDEVIVSGAYDPQDFLSRYDFLPDSVAYNLAEFLADTRNKVIQHSAFIKINGAIVRASMLHAIEQYDAGLLDMNDAANTKYLGYQLGRYSFADTVVDDESQSLEVSHTQLEGLETYGSASNYEVELNDPLGLSRRLHINHIGSTVVSVALVTKLEDDPLIDRSVRLLGPDVASLYPLLVGRHSSEEELDAAITEVWLEYQGTSQEQEITPLLDEVRDRAVATKQDHEFTLEHSSQLPSTDQLDEFVELLKDQ